MWLQPLALMGGTKTIYSNTHVGQFDTSVPDEVGILAWNITGMNLLP